MSPKTVFIRSFVVRMKFKAVMTFHQRSQMKPDHFNRHPTSENQSISLFESIFEILVEHCHRYDVECFVFDVIRVSARRITANNLSKFFRSLKASG